jgi:tetratricopeptide (TPR) repeat protein
VPVTDVPVTDLELAERVLRTWDFTNPAASRTRFAEAAAAEPDPARRQVLLTQVARAEGLQDAFAAGHATLDSLGDPGGMAAEPAVRSLLERGRLHNSAGEAPAAVPLFEQAYHRATAAGLAGLAADAAHMLAIAVPERHEEWANRGFAAAEGSADPLARTMTAALLNNLGWTYADAGRWADALPLFERAVRVRRERGDPEPLHMARWARARTLRALGRHDEALAELRELAGTPEGAADHYVTDEIEANERRLTG